MALAPATVQRMPARLSGHSGEIDHLFRWQTDHLFWRKPITCRSEATREFVMSSGRPFRSTVGFAFASSLLSGPVCEHCVRDGRESHRRASGLPMTSCHFSPGNWLTRVERRFVFSIDHSQDEDALWECGNLAAPAQAWAAAIRPRDFQGPVDARFADLQIQHNVDRASTGPALPQRPPWIRYTVPQQRFASRSRRRAVYLLTTHFSRVFPTQPCTVT